MLDLPSSFSIDGVLIIVGALLYCLQRIERGADLVISHVGGRGSGTVGPGHGRSGTGGLPGCGVGCVCGFPRGRHARVPVRPLACRLRRLRSGPPSTVSTWNELWSARGSLEPVVAGRDGRDLSGRRRGPAPLQSGMPSGPGPRCLRKRPKQGSPRCETPLLRATVTGAPLTPRSLASVSTPHAQLASPSSSERPFHVPLTALALN